MSFLSTLRPSPCTRIAFSTAHLLKRQHVCSLRTQRRSFVVLSSSVLPRMTVLRLGTASAVTFSSVYRVLGEHRDSRDGTRRNHSSQKTRGTAIDHEGGRCFGLHRSIGGSASHGVFTCPFRKTCLHLRIHRQCWSDDSRRTPHHDASVCRRDSSNHSRGCRFVDRRSLFLASRATTVCRLDTNEDGSTRMSRRMSLCCLLSRAKWGGLTVCVDFQMAVDDTEGRLPYWN